MENEEQTDVKTEVSAPTEAEPVQSPMEVDVPPGIVPHRKESSADHFEIVPHAPTK